MQSLQAIRWFFAYPADWHYPVLTSMTSLLGVQGVLTIAMVVVHFEVPRWRWLLGALVPVFAMVAWLSPERQNVEGVRILAVALTVSLACTTWAIWRHRRGAWPAAVGVAISTVLLAIEAEDYRASFFIKFLPALVGLIASLAAQLQHERKRAREVELTAARLECELLKKNLQPHFLFNTLTALSEVVEQNPRMATQLINDLADEFRTVARVSAEKLIPLSQELELCRAHLRVMSVRTACAWTLAVEGAPAEALVPPAVFLTLIENGFVHQGPPEGETVFQLRCERAGDDLTRYTFVSPGIVDTEQRRPVGGTGLRYVKTRLEESFPGRWMFRSEAVAAGWQTVIEVSAVQAGRGVA
jgi:hypothetical protein